ncbi:hypothetical protein ACFLRB_05535 [Acidobacteriota bacterium]
MIGKIFLIDFLTGSMYNEMYSWTGKMNDKLAVNLLVIFLQKPIITILYLYLIGMSIDNLIKTGQNGTIIMKNISFAESPLFARNADRAYKIKNKDYQRR